MSKVFEVRKAGFLNKGAAMMLIAAAREVRAAVPDAIVTVAPDHTMPFQPRADHGLWQRAEIIRGGVDVGKVLELLPRKWRRRYGFVTEGEVDVVLDAAGLAYSDQWGLWHIQDLARRAGRWKAAGKKVVLLPQALGPFGSKQGRENIRRAAECADLIFARDRISYGHIVDAVGEREHIRLAPDFTNLLNPADPGDSLAGFDNPVAVVPNCRMLDKTSQAEASEYVAAMRAVVLRLRKSGLQPFLLIHEGPQDKKLGDEINKGLDFPMTVLWPDDPLVAKGIIRDCRGVVASRFHAIVSALAQGVPALGTSWSHKYKEIFADYDCPECLLQISVENTSYDDALKVLTDSSTHAEMRARLKSRSIALINETKKMWLQVFEVSS